jgi:hypothetical protein
MTGLANRSANRLDLKAYRNHISQAERPAASGMPVFRVFIGLILMLVGTFFRWIGFRHEL